MTDLFEYIVGGESLVSAFFDRVRALTPEQWGRLDAIDARYRDGSLQARAERLRLSAAAFGIANDNVAEAVVGGAWKLAKVGVDVVGGIAGFFADGTKTKVPQTAEERRAQFEANEASRASSDAQVARIRVLTDEFQRLIDDSPHDGIADPRKRGAAQMLGLALLALCQRHPNDEAAFKQAYAPVEPIIPFATLQPVE